MNALQAMATGELTHPRLRENIWHIKTHDETALLITTDSSFEVATEDALKFLKMRSYCTGVHSVDEIAKRSGLSRDEVTSVIASLRDVGVLCPPTAPVVAIEHVRATLLQICKIWSDELRASYIGNEFSRGKLPLTVLSGWLCEMYHYIKDFPLAIEHAARFASGPLKDVLITYANQEKHHDEFVIRTLMNVGLSRDEVKQSTPLVATRTIGLLMREMFEMDPWSVLLMAALVEAQEFHESQIESFKQRLQEIYGLSLGAFEPFFEHQRIDVGLGHAQLLEDHINLVDVTESIQLDRVVNKLHDLKHAFELQSLEIHEYYTNLNGKYFPRQPMKFSSL